MILDGNLDCKFCNKIDCYHNFFKYDDGSVDFYYKINEKDDARLVFEWQNGKLYLCSNDLKSYDLIVDCESIDSINKEFIGNIIKNLVFG